MIHRTEQGGKLESVEVRTGGAMCEIENSVQKGIKSHIKKENQPKELLPLVKDDERKKRKGHTVCG